jgi:hypothetical protein
MRRLSVVLLVALAVAGCKKKEPAQQQAAGAQPGAQGAPAAASIKGKITERLDAEPYSYLKLKTEQGEVWAAVPKSDKKVGDEVVIGGAMPMNDFESKTLKRKFELVYFGTLVDPNAPAAPAGGPGAMGQAGAPEGSVNMAAQHAQAAAGPSDVGSVKVPKASGADARTVAEVFAQRAALKEKGVTIRGKVVKFNEGIMGRNWLHIRDGSGAAGTNDLTITTAEKAAVGDVVVVKGKVQVDKDFGAGYSYPVIVEDAKLGK